MYKLKHYIAPVIILVFLFSFQVGVFADEVDTFAGFDVAAKSAVLMEASTGQVIFEKNAETPQPPASITKVMTLLLAFEALESGKVKWDDEVVISESAWKMDGSQMFLEIGQKVTFGELITGISVVSANDACVAVAEHLYGSENAFVQLMNKRAAELGLKNSRFKNTTGLPAAGHEMSPKDIAVLARHLITAHPKILELETMKEYTFNEIRQFNRNPLLGVFPGADGLKTGWTEEAGYCLVGTAVQSNIRMISVILNTADEKERLVASQELLNYGFQNFEIVKVINDGDIIDEIPVKQGKKHSVPVKVVGDITVVIPTERKSELAKETVNMVDVLNAPVAAGTPVGTFEARFDGKTLGKAELVTAEDVQRASLLTRILRAIGQFFSSLFSSKTDG